MFPTMYMRLAHLDASDNVYAYASWSYVIDSRVHFTGVDRKGSYAVCVCVALANTASCGVRKETMRLQRYGLQ